MADREEFKDWYPQMVAACFEVGAKLPSPSLARTLHRRGYSPEYVAHRLYDRAADRVLRGGGRRRGLSLGGSYDGKSFRVGVPRRLVKALSGGGRKRRSGGCSKRRRGYGSSRRRSGRRY